MMAPRVPARVLVVDDCPHIRDVLARLLRSSGYTVECAADGWEALARLRTQTPPDLILLDLQMPRMDGPSFRAAQRQDPAAASIPVLILSSHPDAQQLAVTMGAADYLEKPVRPERLLEAVRRHCPTAPSPAEF